MPKVVLIGLRISSLTQDPQLTLLGNPMRTWALFTGLPEYGFESHLYVDPGAKVDSHLSEVYGERFVRTPDDFLRRTASGDFDCAIICGTRIQLALEHHPWLEKVTNCPLFLAQCYHNVDTPLPPAFLSNVFGAAFVTPHYRHRWALQHPETRASLMTTGQVTKKPDADSVDGSAVFVGHLHSVNPIRILVELATLDTSRDYHLVSSQIRVPGSKPNNYVLFGPMASEGERQSSFQRLLESVGVSAPSNLHYHYLPPGSEDALLNRASIGLDFSWNPSWTIDNSKVPYYLTYGLNVVAQLPAPSYRFVKRFNAGVTLPYGATPQQWAEAVQRVAGLTVQRKNRLRVAAGECFSWRNTVLDVAAELLDFFDHK